MLAVLLIVGGAFGIKALLSRSDESDPEASGEATAQVNSIDSEMLRNLEPYAGDYENLLTMYAETLKEGGEDVSDGNFNFIYFNDNDIPDLTISFKLPFDNSPNLYDSLLICIDGNEEEIFNAVVAMNTWVGQKGYYVVSDAEFEGGEEFDAFYKYRYEDIDDSKIFSGGLRYDKFLNEEQTYQESWVYMAEAEGDMQKLSGWDEYYEKKDVLLDGFYRVTSGYSIVDFADSGKELVEYLKKAKPERYVLFEEDDESEKSADITTSTTQSVSTAGEYIDATSDDWNNLKLDLEKILTFCNKYNSSSDDAYEVVLPVNCTEMIYSHYFDKAPKYAYGDDPLGYFGESEYYIFNAENVDWIVSNVFNQSPDHNLKTKERYFYNGNYYVIFYPSSCPIVDIAIRGTGSHTADGYTVILSKTMYNGEGYGAVDEPGSRYSVTVQVELKEIDGKKVWSFFSIKTVEFETATEKETTAASKSEWETSYNKV